MKKIIATVGISGSGKSTWAHQYMMENIKTSVIVNRDKIRELLFGYSENTISEYYERKDITRLEKQVTRYEDTLINEGLCADKTVIVDATHLSRKYLERFKYWNVQVELKFFDVTCKEAQVRTMSRTRAVSSDIVQKQYDKYVGLRNNLDKDPIDFTIATLGNDANKPPCIIFDVDNTLAIRGDRSPYDWKRVGEDKPDKSVVMLSGIINNLRRDYKQVEVIICTGRDGECIAETEAWLDREGVEYNRIYIRDKGDMRSDDIIKEEIWREIARDNYIVMMVEDRNSVVRRARSLGLKVAQVEYGNF